MNRVSQFGSSRCRLFKVSADVITAALREVFR
jgi:hypothetical protein